MLTVELIFLCNSDEWAERTSGLAVIYPFLDVARWLLLPSETAEARDARNRAVSTAKIAVLSEVCARIAKAFVEPKHAAGAVS